MESKNFTVNIDGVEKVIVVKKPNEETETEADIYCSQVFAKLAKQKNEDGEPAYMVRSKLNEFLKDIGIYTVNDFQRLGEIGEEVGALEDKIYGGRISKIEGRSAAVKLRELRYEMLTLLNKKASYDAYTIEYHCDNARLDYLITKCITNEEGTSIFKSVADYKQDETIKPHLRECIETLAGFISDYDPEFESKLPENKFLLKFGYCNKDLELIDPVSGHKVNLDGDLINDDGDLIDKDGNVLDINGDRAEREIGVFFDDEEEVAEETAEVVVKKPRKKRVTKKKPVEA